MTKLRIINLIDQYESMKEYYKREEEQAFKYKQYQEVERYNFACLVLDIVIKDLYNLMKE